MKKRRGKKSSSYALRRALSRAYSKKNWFMFPRLWALIMSRDAAFLLAYLVNIAENFHAETHHDGWFYCTVQRISNEIFMDRNVQTRVLNELKELGFIKTEKRGIPAKRYIRIMWEEINTELEAEMSRRGIELDDDNPVD